MPMDEIAYDTRHSATRCEIEYVRGQAQHRERDGPGDKLARLLSYRQSMRWRADWGKIDSAKVLQALDELISVQVDSLPAYTPSNGHGILGSREYARPVRPRGEGPQ